MIFKSGKIKVKRIGIDCFIDNAVDKLIYNLDLLPIYFGNLNLDFFEIYSISFWLDRES
jgi:hypothetical protein